MIGLVALPLNNVLQLSIILLSTQPCITDFVTCFSFGLVKLINNRGKNRYIDICF